MTNTSSCTNLPETTTLQQELADMILTYVDMAHECEINKDDEGAFFLYRGANDALIDLMSCDPAQQKS